MNKSLVAVRVYLQPVVRVLNQAVLGIWSRRRLRRTYSAPRHLRERNEHLQQRFAEVFSRYDACANCVEHCCHSSVNRFDFVDSYLQGRPLGDGVSRWHGIGHLRESISDLIRQMRGFPDEKPPREVCSHFIEAKGCSLPIGQRPSMCITGMCKKLLDSLSDDDTNRYASLMKEYARLRRQCSKELLVDFHRRDASDLKPLE